MFDFRFARGVEVCVPLPAELRSNLSDLALAVDDARGAD